MKINILQFDGVNDYVRIPHSASQISTNWTLEAWVKPEQDNGSMWGAAITSKTQVGAAFYRKMGVRNGKFHSLYTNPAVSVNLFLESTTKFILGQWYHLAISYDGNIMKLFVNGIEENSVTCGGIAVNTEPFDMGARNTQPGEYFKGQIAEVRLWNLGRSGKDIKNNANKRLAGSESGLAGYWPLNGDASDKTAGGNAGTINGATWKEEDLSFLEPLPKKVPDNLAKIEGIGPKIAELLQKGEITTYAQLATTPVEEIDKILTAAGRRYSTAVPTTWPEQAALAAAGKWDELKKLQDELDGGRR